MGVTRRGFLRKCLGLASAMLLPAAKILELPYTPNLEPESESPIYSLMQATLRDLGKQKSTEIATDGQSHVAMYALLKTGKVVYGSQSIAWNVALPREEKSGSLGSL